MRDELKTQFWTAVPVYVTDSYNQRVINGYTTLKSFRGLIVETEEREVMDDFGYRPNYSLHIIVDPEQAASFTASVNDAVYLELPTPLRPNVYPDPPYILDAVRRFGNKISLDARKQV